MDRFHSTPNEFPKTDARYWRHYLTTRKYVESAEYFALIEDEEKGFYFPLGSNDEEQAAEMARRIHVAISEEGWEAACSWFVREVTIGIFWNQNPATATYATLFSRLQPPDANAKKGAVRAAIIEPDVTLRNALRQWLNEIPGYSCAADYAGISEALADKRLSEKAELVFCNCGYFGTPDYYPRQLKPLRERLPAFPLTIHPNSDSVFIHMTDATQGYYLKRTKLHEILAPLSGVERDASKHDTAIWQYFRSLWLPVSSPRQSSSHKTLTPREWEILEGLSQGLLNKEIAARFEISLHTVHNHLNHLFRKLGVNNRTEALLWYLQK